MNQWSARLIYVVLLALPTGLAALTDPTRPAHFRGEKVAIRKGNADIKLSSIIVSKERRFATINGKTVQEGDKINNFEVIAIKRGYVVLSGDDDTFKVHLFQDITRTVSNPQ